MNEDFVTFEISKKLKEKGYQQKTGGRFSMIGPCYFDDGRFYEDGLIGEVDYCFTAPTIAQAMKWLRKEKKLSVEAFYGTVVTGNKFIDDAIKPCWSCCVVPTSENFYGIRTDLFKSTTNFASWEDAALAGVEYALDNLI